MNENNEIEIINGFKFISKFFILDIEISIIILIHYEMFSFILVRKILEKCNKNSN